MMWMSTFMAAPAAGLKMYLSIFGFQRSRL